jgi:hypothetical protein
MDDHVTHPGDPSKPSDYESGYGLGSISGQVDAARTVNLRDRYLGVNDKRPTIRLGLCVVLVANIAHQFLDEIFQRDHAHHVGIVRDDRQVATPTLHLEQQVVTTGARVGMDHRTNRRPLVRSPAK